mmetsp:Transcript_123906/g.219568  ORF Transcript_123906/g.219568 Transcript_123906/m.219568 type:complete len:299 (-) Transcript_123906:155-1051(-)
MVRIQHGPKPQNMPRLPVVWAFLSALEPIRPAAAEYAEPSCMASPAGRESRGSQGHCLNLLQSRFASQEMPASTAQNLVAGEGAAADHRVEQFSETPPTMPVASKDPPSLSQALAQEGDGQVPPHQFLDQSQKFFGGDDMSKELSPSLEDMAANSMKKAMSAAETNAEAAESLGSNSTAESNSTSNLSSELATEIDSTNDLNGSLKVEANYTSNATSDVAAEEGSASGYGRVDVAREYMLSNITDAAASDASVTISDMLLSKPMSWSKYLYTKVTMLGDHALLFVLVFMVVAKIMSWA